MATGFLMAWTLRFGRKNIVNAKQSFLQLKKQAHYIYGLFLALRQIVSQREVWTLF